MLLKIFIVFITISEKLYCYIKLGGGDIGIGIEWHRGEIVIEDVIYDIQDL